MERRRGTPSTAVCTLLWTSQRDDRSALSGHLTLQWTDGGDAEDAANPSGVCGLADGISRLGVPLGGDVDLPL